MKRATLEMIVSNLINASISESWKGGGDPADIPEIDLALDDAKLAYIEALDRLVDTQELLTE